MRINMLMNGNVINYTKSEYICLCGCENDIITEIFKSGGWSLEDDIIVFDDWIGEAELDDTFTEIEYRPDMHGEKPIFLRLPKNTDDEG